MAFLYLRHLAFDDALERIRSGVQALNRANGVIETPTSGYHETVTVAWARIVSVTLSAHGPRGDFDTFADANPHVLTKSLLRLYYTHDRIFTEQAKSSFVEPDLAPLPRPSPARS